MENPNRDQVKPSKYVYLLCTTISILCAFISALIGGTVLALGYYGYSIFFIAMGFLHAHVATSAYDQYRQL